MSGATWGQTSVLTLGNASGPAGSTVPVTLSLNSPSGSEPQSIQWTLTYSPTDVAAIAVTPTGTASAAGKLVQCSGMSGAYICLMYGLNSNAIQNGAVAVLDVTLAPSVGHTVAISVAGAQAAAADASALPISGVAGAISLGAPNPPGVPSPPGNPPSGLSITGLLCDSTVLGSGSTSSCTVFLSQAAPSGGVAVALSSSSALLKLPASVTVAEGSSSAGFTLSTNVVSSNASAVVTAMLGGSTGRLVVSLNSGNLGPQGSNPVITGIPAGILDAGSYTPNVAQGSIFVVKGSNLCPDGVVQANGYPLSTTLNGVSITLSPNNGGTSVAPYMIYTYSRGGVSQLAALLPSTTPAGSYNATVTANGVTSPTVPVTVVGRKFELFSADSSGTGAAALQTVDAAGAYHYNRLTTAQAASAPAHPGDFVIAYGTGLGPIQATDQMPPGILDMRDQTDIHLLVNGEAIAPLYAGRSPDYPGLDQINFQLPPDVPTGCTATVQVSVGGRLSHETTMAIAPAGGTVCSPSPVSRDILTRLDLGGNLTVGDFWLAQLASTSSQPAVAGSATVDEAAVGSFVTYSGFQLAGAAVLLNPAGSCQVSHVVGNAAQLAFGPMGGNLDAGTLTLNGPGVTNLPFAVDPRSGTYFLSLGGTTPQSPDIHLPLGVASFDASPEITAGSYQLTGNGGADIGKFSAALTVGQRLTISGGLPMSVDRSRDLVLSWSGGSAGDVVTVTGISGTIIGGTAGAPIYDAGRLTCSAVINAGSITIPSSLLSRLPPTPAAARDGIGYLAVASGAAPAATTGTFTAPLTAGGNVDYGFFLGRLGVFATTSFQ